MNRHTVVIKIKHDISEEKMQYTFKQLIHLKNKLCGIIGLDFIED